VSPDEQTARGQRNADSQRRSNSERTAQRQRDRRNNPVARPANDETEPSESHEPATIASEAKSTEYSGSGYEQQQIERN
jgi:hypothetical protein